MENIITEEIKLRPAIAALKVGEHVDIPRGVYTTSAARKAVQRIAETWESLAEGYGGKHLLTPKYRTSETAYPGGTRVTRIS